METTLVMAMLASGSSAALGVWLFVARRRAAAADSRAAAAESRAAGAERVASELTARFRPVVDAEAAAAAAREAASAIEADIVALREKYQGGLQRMGTLEATLRGLEEDLESVEVGLYRPHFTYRDTESYKRAIVEVREKQKALVKASGATSCGTTWTVGGSAKEGTRMVKQTEKLILRAFNAEAEAAVRSVSWSNHDVMANRIGKTFEVLNKHGTVLQVSLTRPYLDLRLEELRLVFEAEHKAHEEREEQRRKRAEQREEERAQRELQREREEAEEDESRFEKAIAKAQAELASSREAERGAMLARIQALEADLATAHARKERAVAQAQVTKVGHVYVISNVGAFGEGVVKIGLTRRLDPEERVRELGDASVPFPFDVHALIHSDDAPDLEAKLHERFWDRRLNWANDRKEFFRVDLPELQGALADLGLPVEVLTVAEAREYRETLAAVATREVPVASAKPLAQARLPEDPFSDAR